MEPIRSPDVWFSEARAAGLGDQLEAAALRVALASPPHPAAWSFLSVNIDPDSLGNDDVLEVLERADLERVVLELTEHTSVSDYDALEPRAAAAARARAGVSPSTTRGRASRAFAMFCASPLTC